MNVSFLCSTNLIFIGCFAMQGCVGTSPNVPRPLPDDPPRVSSAASSGPPPPVPPTWAPPASTPPSHAQIPPPRPRAASLNCGKSNCKGPRSGTTQLPRTGPSSTSTPPSDPTSTAATSAATKFAAEAGKIDALVTGSAAVSSPASVKVGELFTVYLRVSPEKLNSLLEGLQKEHPGNSTLKGKEGVKLTSRMVASIKGIGFEFSPKDGQIQGVGAGTTTWDWQVRPLESGPLTLTVTLAGTLMMEDKEVPRNFFQYEQKVDVAVSPTGFFSKYWQWLATTLAIPVVSAIWAVFRRPKTNSERPRSSVAERLREKLKKRTSG